MKTDIVILNWNGRDFLHKYLPSVLDSVKEWDDAQVVVADNASTDGSLELLGSEFPAVRTILLDKNYGFAEGYNKALKQLDAEYFLLLNSDVEVTPGWLEPLVQWMDLHEDCGICGPKILSLTNRDTFEYAGAAGGYLDRWCFPFCRGRVMDRLEKDEGQYDIPEEVLWVSGAALMVRAEVFSSLGGFCKDFFAHMEEIDLCWRARLEGWKVNIVPRSAIYHLGGGSLPQGSPRKLCLNYRNNLLMMSRNLPKTYALSIAMNTVARCVNPEEGPDLFALCYGFFGELARSEKKDFASMAAILGARKAKRTIRKRMAIDRIAALVYLLKGHVQDYKAVRKAHSEFKSSMQENDLKKLTCWTTALLEGKRDDIALTILTADTDGENLMRDSFALKGMWAKWSIWRYLVKKDAIFAEIKDNIK